MFTKDPHMHKSLVLQFIRKDQDVRITMILSSADSVYHDMYYKDMRRFMYIKSKRKKSTKRFWKKQIRRWESKVYHDVKTGDTYFHIPNGRQTLNVKLKLKNII